MPEQKAGESKPKIMRSGPRRFRVAPVPNGESASYLSDPYNQSVNTGFLGTVGAKNKSIGTIVLPADSLIIAKGGTRALSLYQNLLIDEHVQACFSKLVQEITSRPYHIIPYSESPGDIAVKEFVENALDGINLDRVYRGLSESMLVGFSLAEVIWKKTPRGIIPQDIRMRDQRRFVWEESDKAKTGFSLRCLTVNDTFKGNELPERKFIVQKHWVQANGDPYGYGLGKSLYPLVKFRRRAIESYVLFGDRYASPTTIAIAPLSATEEDCDMVFDMIANLSQETAAVLPDGWQIDSISPQGNSDVHQKLVEYLDKEISILICGENEAGQAEAGSRASSEVANLVRVVRAAEISEDISNNLTNSLIRWIVDLNFGVDVMAPKIEREFRIEESTIAPADLTLIREAMGYVPTKDWAERHFRIDFEEEKKPIEGDVAQGGIPGGGEPDFLNPESGEDVDFYSSIFGDETE